MRRHGRLELLLVLPDGSKSLVPAAWTDVDAAAGAETMRQATVGSVADLLAAHERVIELVSRFATAIGQAQAARQSPCEEDNRAACAAQSDARPDTDATEGVDRRDSRPTRSRGGRGAGSFDRQDRRAGSGRAERDGGRR
jgi:hypothetical protein